MRRHSTTAPSRWPEPIGGCAQMHPNFRLVA